MMSISNGRFPSRVASALLLSAAIVFGNAASAATFSGPDYTAEKLLSPCQEADNDARWGEAAETECEQYMLGFVDALAEVGATGASAGICPPKVNTADEVRWAFMRWVHADFSKRRGMPAGDALIAMLREQFACK